MDHNRDWERLAADEAAWAHCPSTHCERAQECRSPSDCSGARRLKKLAGVEERRDVGGWFMLALVVMLLAAGLGVYLA